MDNKSEDIERLGKPEYKDGMLIKHGIIIFEGSIFDAEPDIFSKSFYMMQFLKVQNELEADHITVRIEDSSGGTVSSALAMYDVIREFSNHLEIPVVTIGVGGVYSAAAAILLQAGDERIAAVNSTFLLHEIRQFKFISEETKSDIEDQQVIMEMLENKLYGILSEKTGKSREEIDRLIDRRNLWLDAQGALEWGLVDRIE